MPSVPYKDKINSVRLRSFVQTAHRSHDRALAHRAREPEEARTLALLCDLLDSFEYKGKDKGLVKPDREVVFPWSPEAAKKGLLAH